MQNESGVAARTTLVLPADFVFVRQLVVCFLRRQSYLTCLDGSKSKFVSMPLFARACERGEGFQMFATRRRQSSYRPRRAAHFSLRPMMLEVPCNIEDLVHSICSSSPPIFRLCRCQDLSLHRLFAGDLHPAFGLAEVPISP